MDNCPQPDVDNCKPCEETCDAPCQAAEELPPAINMRREQFNDEVYQREVARGQEIRDNRQQVMATAHNLTQAKKSEENDRASNSLSELRSSSKATQDEIKSRLEERRKLREQMETERAARNKECEQTLAEQKKANSDALNASKEETKKMIAEKIKKIQEAKIKSKQEEEQRMQQEIQKTANVANELTNAQKRGMELEDKLHRMKLEATTQALTYTVAPQLNLPPPPVAAYRPVQTSAIAQPSHLQLQYHPSIPPQSTHQIPAQNQQYSAYNPPQVRTQIVESVTTSSHTLVSEDNEKGQIVEEQFKSETVQVLETDNSSSSTINMTDEHKVPGKHIPINISFKNIELTHTSLESNLEAAFDRMIEYCAQADCKETGLLPIYMGKIFNAFNELNDDLNLLLGTSGIDKEVNLVLSEIARCRKEMQDFYDGLEIYHQAHQEQQMDMAEMISESKDSLKHYQDAFLKLKEAAINLDN